MTLPISTAKLTLYEGVPLTPDYNHTRWYSSNTPATRKAHQVTFFSSFTSVDFNDFTVVKRNGLSLTIKVARTSGELLRVNYARFIENNNQVYTEENFVQYYAFIQNKRMIQKDVYELDLLIDVMQTFHPYITFKDSYFERRHVRRFSGGNPLIYPHDEQLDYGSNYVVKNVQKLDFTKNLKWLVIISKIRFDSDDVLNPINKVESTIIGGIPQPLTCYFLPFRNDYGYSGDGTVVSSPTRLLEFMYKAVNAQNNIVSIFVTEHPGLTYSYSGVYPPPIGASGLFFADPSEFESVFFHDASTDLDARCYRLKSINTFTPLSVSVSIPSLFGTTPTESKLMISPYRKLALVDNQGGYTEFKPELFKNPNGTITFNMRGSIGVNNKVSVYTNDYGNSLSTPMYFNEIADMFGIINSEPNDVPVLTDNLSAFIQGNRNSIINSKNQAQFNTVVAGANAVGNIIQNGHNPAGAVGSAISGGANLLNAQFSVEAINAQLRDISNVPPNLSNQGVNTFFSYGNGQVGFYLIAYEILDQYKTSLGEYFKRYGYKINNSITPTFLNLRSRTNYDYIKMADAGVFGSIDPVYLDEIRNIFTRGITLWHNNDIGNYTLNNGEV